MGFLDKAKAAADQLAAKADTALASSGLGGPAAANPEKLFRDLGVLAYLGATGRPASPEEHDRVLTALRGLESGGTHLNFTLQTAAPPPAAAPPAPGTATAPPPPGAAAAPPPPPPPPGAAAAPPPAAPEAPVDAPVDTPAAPEPPSAVAPPPPPPPPPSWMNKDDGSA